MDAILRSADRQQSPRLVRRGGAGGVCRPSAFPSIAGIIPHCHEQPVGADIVAKVENCRAIIFPPKVDPTVETGRSV
jgi:hypothetical protein